VIHRFATDVADRERLDLLYLLTCADIAGTSPKLWNAWKDRLLADLHTATRLALRRGLEHPVAAADRKAEARAEAKANLQGFGIDAAEADRLFAAMPEETFLRARPDQIAWQATVVRHAPRGGVRVSARTLNVRGAAQVGALEVFVHAPDRDGLFAAIVATLDRAGLAIQQARLFDGPDGQCSSTPSKCCRPKASAACRPRKSNGRLTTALAADDLDTIKPARRNQPRHLRHSASHRSGLRRQRRRPPRTLVSLVCTDRPGLLADVTQGLRAQRLRVHDARIATFGARAEDVFQLTDERRPTARRHAPRRLARALQTLFEGDAR
jgi:[protein-PII] uridylyltransferase